MDEGKIMNVGTAQINITPEPGIELAGFAVRTQPSQRVLDPLWVRVLYLEENAEKLLWIHGDVLAFDENIVGRLRDWVWRELAIPPTKVVIAATHTHSGPATIQLTGCGKVDTAYIAWLEDRCREAVMTAIKNLDRCHLVSAEGKCQLGIDRLNTAINHTDSKVGAIGWRRTDGSYKAVFLTYAMHPVCLKATLVSGDWPGETARFLTAALPGAPVVIVSSGACGNINPPQVGVSPDQTYKWGRQVAQSVMTGLLNAKPEAMPRTVRPLRMTTTTIDLPLESWSEAGIEKYAAECLADGAGHREFGAQFPQAVELWRANMLQQFQQNGTSDIQVVMGVLSLDRITILTVNAEIFSGFTELVNSEADGPVYTVGCANGMIGYLPSAEAYLANGYEVSWSMFFYNKPRLRKGGLELLAQHARKLVRGYSIPQLQTQGADY